MDLDEMDLCGSVFMSKDIKTFTFKCCFCKDLLSQWHEFFFHIKELHKDRDDRSWADAVQIDECKMEMTIEHLDTTEEYLQDDPIDEDHEPKHNVVLEQLECVIEQEQQLSEQADEQKFNYDSDLDNNYNLTTDDEEDDEHDDDEDNDDDDYENVNTRASSNKAKKLSNKFSPTFFRHNNLTSYFIKLLKEAACLWNPKDVHGKDKEARLHAQKNIIEKMSKKFEVNITPRQFNNALRKLHSQYWATDKMLKAKRKGPKVSSLVMEYYNLCDFFSCSKEAPKDVTGCDEVEVETTKILSFGKPNDLTKFFIDTYKQHSILYDPGHMDRTFQGRKQAMTDIAENLRIHYDLDYSESAIYNAIHALKQWVYKAYDHQDKNDKLNSVQQYYLDNCPFIPRRENIHKSPCEICGKVLFTARTLQVHKFKEHNIGELPYKCKECDATFEQKSSLQTHKQRKHLGKVYSCKFCSHRFAVLVDMQRHEATHTGEKKFVCDQCGKNFRLKTQLTYHNNAIHLKNRAFKCHLCPKDFLKSGDLKDHIKAHLNIRDKICETCGKGFTNCHSLIRHRQIHSEVKKFECKMCDAKFHQFVGLNAHMKRTHNIIKNKEPK